MRKTDITALQKWSKIPKDMQRKILDNVFLLKLPCDHCS